VRLIDNERAFFSDRKSFHFPSGMAADGVVTPSAIHAYTVYTLNAFKKVAIANVDKVTLEFGIELGGEAGVPYVTKGTAKSNLKITVECSFPEQTESKPSQASNS